MNRCIVLLFFCALTLPLAAIDGTNRRPAQKQTTGNAADHPKTPDVCKLLSSDEIQGVQGEAVEETKPMAQSGGALRVSECVFRTTTAAKAISVALATPAAQQPRDYWHKRFHAGGEGREYAASKSERKAKAGDEEEASRPRPINGVGDEAYWVGGRVTGALYVLRGNSFIRISVGGVREEPVRIQRSIALARAALKRL